MYVCMSTQWVGQWTLGLSGSGLSGWTDGAVDSLAVDSLAVDSLAVDGWSTLTKLSVGCCVYCIVLYTIYSGW